MDSPYLPPEIWHRIFTFAANTSIDSYEPYRLWSIGRRVSREWRSAFAEAYADVFLRNHQRCIIRFDAHSSWDLDFVFSRYDEKDRSRCFFKLQDPVKMATLPDYFSDEKKREHVKGVLPRLSSSIGQYVGDGHKERRFDLSPHVVCFYGHSIDSDLPGLRFDLENGEVSFTWEAMLDALCKEQAELCRRQCAQAERIGIEFRERCGGDFEKLFDDGITEMIEAMEESREQCLLEVRRLRINYFYAYLWSVDVDDARDVRIGEQLRLRRIKLADGVGKDPDEVDIESEDEDTEEEDCEGEEGKPLEDGEAPAVLNEVQKAVRV